MESPTARRTIIHSHHPLSYCVSYQTHRGLIRPLRWILRKLCSCGMVAHLPQYPPRDLAIVTLVDTVFQMDLTLVPFAGEQYRIFVNSHR